MRAAPEIGSTAPGAAAILEMAMDSRTDKQPALTPIHQETAPLRLRIIEEMRRAIENGRLKPGERLVEKDLCQQLGVSRTSLREALRELESEGVVEQAGARGLTVVRLSRRDAENIYRIRADLESLVVQQFITDATDVEIAAAVALCEQLIESYKSGSFNRIIGSKRELFLHLCKVADNRIALELLSRLTLRTAQLRRASLIRPERQAQSIGEIRLLAEAIEARDVALGRDVARAHVDSAARSALDVVTEPS